MATATETSNRVMNGQAIAARAEAVTQLIKANQDEFNRLLAEERTKRGLSATAGGESTKALEERAAKQLAKLAKLRTELEARGVDVDSIQPAAAMAK